MIRRTTLNMHGQNENSSQQNKINTYYIKAKDDLLREELQDRMNYQNKLEFEVSKRTRETTVDKTWRQKAARVKMMNDLLKNKLVEFTTELASITNVEYNFKDRKITKPEWMKDPYSNQQNNNTSQQQVKKKLKQESLLTYKRKINETFDPIPTPNGELQEDFLNLRENLKIAIRSKKINDIQQYVEEATLNYPMELEYLICHGELIIKKFNDRMQDSTNMIFSNRNSEQQQQQQQYGIYSNKQSSQNTQRGQLTVQNQITMKQRIFTITNEKNYETDSFQTEQSIN